MSTLTTTRNFATGTVLYKSDFDDFLSDIEEFFNTTGITDGNIQGTGIDGSLKLAEASISTAKIASDAVTTVKLADGAVGTVNINTDAVTTAKIADDAVTTAKIADSAITTAKIADTTIARTKLDDTNYELSSNITLSSTVTTTTTIATLNIESNGRAVLVGVRGLSAAISSALQLRSNSVLQQCTGYISLKRDGTLIAKYQIASDQAYASLLSSASIYMDTIVFLDPSPTAGTRTYTIVLDVGANSNFYVATTLTLGQMYLLEL